jgi:cation transporter-like permease
MKHTRRRARSSAFLHGSMLPYSVRSLGLSRLRSTRTGQDPDTQHHPTRATQSSFYGALVLFLAVTLFVGFLLTIFPF